MKKKILGLSVLVGSAMLVGCTDPSSDNSALLQNALQKADPTGTGTAQFVGINQADIPSFENNNGQNPTQVTVTYSGRVNAAKEAGCLLVNAFGDEIETGLTSTSISLATNIGGFDSLLGYLQCQDASSSGGPYSADITISFTAGGKSYTANTTLTADGGEP